MVQPNFAGAGNFRWEKYPASADRLFSRKAFDARQRVGESVRVKGRSQERAGLNDPGPGPVEESIAITDKNVLIANSSQLRPPVRFCQRPHFRPGPFQMKAAGHQDDHIRVSGDKIGPF